MRDRVSTKILDNGATRYGVYDETGKLLRYEYIKLEDEPTVEGDLFSKANMLPDSIPAALGLKMGNPQVKDALNVLANVGNLHVWKRVQTYREDVPAGYTLGPSKQIELIKGKNNSGSSISYRTITVSYSSSISVSENGDNITLNSPSTVNLRPDYPAEGVVLRGKFIQVTQWDSTYVDTVSGVLFIQSDASFADDYPNSLGWHSLTCSSAQVVTGTPAIPAGTTTDYLTSTDRNAYPDNVTDAQDAYYTLGDVVRGATIATLTTTSTVFFTVKKSDSVIVSEDGIVSLPSTATENEVRLNNDSDKDSIFADYKGCFVQLVGNGNVTANIKDVIWIPSDAVFSGLKHITVSKYQPVTGHAAIPANTTITYLGQLGGGARIEVGSYVGTGTQGSANPTSLTFNFVPKMVIVTKQGQYGFALDGTFSSYSLFWIPGITYCNPGGSGSSSYADAQKNKITLSGKTLSWYRDSTSSNGSASHQLNGSGKTYQWIALG